MTFGHDSNAVATELAVLFTFGALLGGCAHFQPKPIDPVQSALEHEARTLSDAGLRAFIRGNSPELARVWPLPSWNLAGLTLVALYYHPSLAVARAQVAVADAGVITAGARPNPSVSLIGQHNGTALTGTSRTVGGTLDVPVETAGKRGHRIGQARYLAQAARWRATSDIWLLRSRVRANLLAAYSGEDLVRHQLDVQQEYVASLERRFAAGSVSQPDLTQARLAFNALTLALRESQKQRAESLARLATALGVSTAALENETVSFKAFEQVPPLSALPLVDLRQRALTERPDLLAALAEYAASQAALQLEIAKQYPDFQLGPGYLWDAGQAKWSLALSLVLPLLNRNQGPIAEARARREQSAANFMAIQARALGELEQAHAGYRLAVKKLAAADEALAAQTQNEQSATRRYHAGELDKLGWLSAQLEEATAELARHDTLVEAQQSFGALEDAVQRPLTADVPSTLSIDNDPRPTGP